MAAGGRAGRVETGVPVAVSAASASSLFRFEGFVLDEAHRSLRHADRVVELRPRSFDVLAYLAGAAGRAVGKDELLQAMWPGVVVTEDSLTRCISDIRQALGDDGQRIIKTLPRRGYVFVAQLSAPADPADPEGAAPGGLRQPPAQRGWLWAGAALLVAGIVVGIAMWWSGNTPAVPDAPRLSIAVLPLASRNAEQAWFADAMTEEITVDLSRIPDAVVIARSSAESYRGKAVDARQVGRELGVRYVLEGQLDRIDDAVRLTLQLIDAGNGRALWSERIDGDRRDLGELQRRVTATVANSLQIRLVEVESVRSLRRTAAGVDAQDLALQAWSLTESHRTPEAIAQARELAERAVASDPKLAYAWAMLARSYSRDVGGRYMHLRGATRQQWLQRAIEAADRAYMLDPNDSRVVGTRAFALALQGRSDEALVLYERAVALNRNDALAWHGISYANATLGRQDESVKAGHEAIRLSPRDDSLNGFYVVIAAAHLYAGRDREALEMARRSALERPDHSVAHSWVASAAAHLGDHDQARAAIAEFRRLLPHYTVASFRAEKLCANALCEAQRERYYAGLRLAGLPE
jgi:TolB-like protein/DNA-binding winged helix-turn-helix (wHTH) protein